MQSRAEPGGGLHFPPGSAPNAGRLQPERRPNPFLVVGGEWLCLAVCVGRAGEYRDPVAALDVLRSIAACPVVRSMSDTTTVPDSRRDQVETLTLEELAHELECSRWLVDDRIDPSVISRRALLSDDLVHGLAQR